MGQQCFRQTARTGYRDHNVVIPGLRRPFPISRRSGAPCGNQGPIAHEVKYRLSMNAIEGARGKRLTYETTRRQRPTHSA
jgi:hypothetical protein